ncbi:winged helix-turn-helix domain-containing tetratricopeptide repeat protein [uncultured Tateyamaria sp.]|uniref:winged helix-turn-helix domain-containing tetratricopeptide repeat protein n=1 Tax=uncultured Tateyamaria sp. TaxID=455651 RepID=UPI002633E945|nr:winged helix-turn-helix domain-containing protein [uncultured Tateyamaria sp.]
MKVRIADAEIDFDKMTVRDGDAVRKLTRQPLGILRVLVDAGGNVVTKDQLVDKVWDGRIVTEATLSTAIKEARRAVGDTGAAQRIIKTVHGVGFQLALDVDDAPTQTRSAMPCLLVLPFRNTSRAPDVEYVCDGLTDEIITSLSCFRGLSVLSRTTSDVIQAAKLDPTTIHSRYDVNFVVEGSVRMTPERIRVSVQLMSTENGTVVVTEQFDRDATVASVFDVQDQIAQMCAGRLAGPHGPVAQATAETAHRQDQHSSWQMFRLVADFRRFYRTYDPVLHAELRAAFPSALERDPQSASGWAAYAVLLLEEHRYHVNERAGVDALSLATSAAEHAVQADNRNAFAQVALAMCRLFAMDVPGFDAAADKALQLNPGNSDVLSEIGHCYAFLGREDDAIRLLDRAMEISPEHPGWYHFAKTWRYARLDMFEAALVEVQKVPMPGFYWYHAHLIWLHSALGHHDRAAAEVVALRAVFPEFEHRVHEELGMWDANADLAASALAHWRAAGLVISEPAAAALD